MTTTNIDTVVIAPESDIENQIETLQIENSEEIQPREQIETIVPSKCKSCKAIMWEYFDLISGIILIIIGITLLAVTTPTSLFNDIVCTLAICFGLILCGTNCFNSCCRKE